MKSETVSPIWPINKQFDILSNARHTNIGELNAITIKKYFKSN